MGVAALVEVGDELADGLWVGDEDPAGALGVGDGTVGFEGAGEAPAHPGEVVGDGAVPGLAALALAAVVGEGDGHLAGGAAEAFEVLAQGLPLCLGLAVASSNFF